MNNLQNKIILLLLFVNLSNQCLKAQNPTGHKELMSIEKSSPCFLGYNDGPGPFQGAPGHDFTSMRHDSDQGEDGALVITGKTHPSQHGPLYYTLSEGDDIDCYPGEGLVDISKNPIVQLRIKASAPVQIRVYIQEGNSPSWDYSKFSKTHAIIDITTDWQVVQIPSISSTNLSGEADAVDLTQIGSVVFELGTTYGTYGMSYYDFDGEIYVDYIELGDFVRNDTSLVSDSNDSIRTALQNRLNEGETPFEIYQSGTSLESLYGLTYQGGLIAHLNLSNGTGFVAAPNDQGKAPWGCQGELLDGADGIAIGTGQQNTADILAGCSEAGIAAALCSNLTLGDYSDWFLPSLDELNELYTNLYLRGLGGFNSSEKGIYWSSKESGGDVFAWWQEFSDGDQFYNSKNAIKNVRAIRNFTDEGFDSCFSLAPNISESTQINCSSTFSTLNANVQGGNPPYTYNWSMSDVSGNDETFKTGKTGSVQLIVKDQAGCSDTSTYVVKTHTFGSKSSDQKIFREDFDFKNESTLPCFLGWDPVAAFQGAPGHDFTNMLWDKENGDMVFSATTNSNNHAPMYYTLTAPSVDGDCFPGEGITDISENPSFEIRLKASTPVTINLYIQEGNNPSWNYEKFSESFLTMHLTTEYQTFYLDSVSSYKNRNYWGPNEQIDLTQIGGIVFELGKSDGVNYDQLVNETIHVDYFQFGGYCELDSCKNLRADYEIVQPFSCSNTSSIIKAKGRMGSPGYSYTWPDSPNLLNDSTIEVTNSGFYKIIVSDTQNCTDTSSIYVPENPFGIEEIDLEPFFINSEFRTGFTRLNKLKLINNGCLNASGEIYIVLDHLTTYLQYLDAADRVSGDTLFWSFDNLTADSIDFNSLFDIQTSVLAAIGDTVCFTVALNYVDGQENELKYSKKYCFPIINGYDPNDISVHPSACPSGYVKNTDVLTYKIRFQNTGNAEAININVMDTLSPYLDASTLKVIETSHPDILKTFLLNDSVIKFAFDEIWLKDSTNHEPESHGHVLYQISQKPNLDLGTEIFNKADIYFDYNPAVVTNTVMSTVTDFIPECMAKVNGKSETVQNPGFIYPNPNSGEFTILFEREISDGRIEIFNVEGKSVYQQQVSGNKNFVVSVQLSKGVYFVKLTNEKYIGESKFVVK